MKPLSIFPAVRAALRAAADCVWSISPTWRNALAVLPAVLVAADPALAQSLDLSPVQNLLQGIVDAITGPLGIVIGTLALIGVFLSWLFGIIDFRQALWTIVGIAGVAAAPTIVSAIWGGGGAP